MTFHVSPFIPKGLVHEHSDDERVFKREDCTHQLTIARVSAVPYNIRDNLL